MTSLLKNLSLNEGRSLLCFFYSLFRPRALAAYRKKPIMIVAVLIVSRSIYDLVTMGTLFVCFAVVFVSKNARLMKANVIGDRHDLKIFGSIVQLIMIDVMHDLIVSKAPPKAFFHHKPVGSDTPDSFSIFKNCISVVPAGIYSALPIFPIYSFVWISMFLKPAQMPCAKAFAVFIRNTSVNGALSHTYVTSVPRRESQYGR